MALAVTAVFLLAALLAAGPAAAIQWQLCDDTLRPVTINAVSLFPDPGIVGSPAKFMIAGTLSQDVQSGSVGIEVSFSGVPIFATQEALCDKVSGACPARAGPFGITLVEALPPIAPPGFYGLRVTAQDQAGTDLLCLSVDFELQYPPPQQQPQGGSSTALGRKGGKPAAAAAAA